jgi:hypothetical protein
LAVLSGVAYKAMAPGETNATMVFSNGVQTADGKSTDSNSTSRAYAFNIHKMARIEVITPHNTAHYHYRAGRIFFTSNGIEVKITNTR